MQHQRNRQIEFETKNLESPSTELPTKTVKAVMQVNNAIEATAKNALEINYEKAASEAIDKVKQDLATKEIEQRLKQEIDRHRLKQQTVLEQHGLGTVSGQSSLGTFLGRCSLGIVLDQSSLGTKQSWDTSLGTVVLGQ